MSNVQKTDTQKIAYYKKRVNDARLTDGQRRYATTRIAKLSGQTPVTVNTTSTKQSGTLDVNVRLFKSSDGKPFATARIVKEGK